MRAVDIIRKKRDGAELLPEEIQFMVDGSTGGQVPDYQVSAWLMATLLKGMSDAETAALTQAMLHSGKVLDFSALPAAKVDKHSTGGVGDKTSLVLAPLVAAGGLYVPMISGRGLGHTGGTLDKLESIPGFNVNLSAADFRRVLEKCGCAMIGQTAEVAPADKKLYALRDVTGTVESPGLICASIMSKKMAEGIDALVLDVKTGGGAFMKKPEDAIHLAEIMVATGRRMEKNVVALITDMDQPLGSKVGNALEVMECVEVMRGGGPRDLIELCVELGGWMFYLGKRSATVEEGKRLAQELIASGAALERFRQMVRLQGGNAEVIDHPTRLPQANSTEVFKSPATGFVGAIDCQGMGAASCALGGGRGTKDDKIDFAVGLVLHKKVGERVSQGEPLCTVHYNHPEKMRRALEIIKRCYRITASAPEARTLVQRVISSPAAKATQ
jgi:pyrimidine-nucleoside phosphorylase